MIITRAPLRVSFFGGGTDLPSYFERWDSEVISMTIGKYIYITGNPMFQNSDILLKYSKLERVGMASQLQHPIAREILREFRIDGYDIGVTSDFPAGTGMGSSSAFTVGLLKLISERLNLDMSKLDLAKKACEIEINRLNEPIGFQDQFASAYGGLNRFQFSREGTKVTPITLEEEVFENFCGSLFLLPVGNPRSAGKILSAQKNLSMESAKELKYLHEMRSIAKHFSPSTFENEYDFAMLLRTSWELKKLSNSMVTNPMVDKAIEIGFSIGATAGKLLGAGESGFILFYAPQCARDKFFSDGLRMKLGLIQVKPDFEGAKTIYSDEEKHD